MKRTPRFQGRLLTRRSRNTGIPNDNCSPAQPTHPNVIEIKSFSAPFALCGLTLADCPENEPQRSQRTQIKKDMVMGTLSALLIRNNVERLSARVKSSK